MEKNYRVVFPSKSKVEIVESEIPTPRAGEVLIKNIVTQISTGTELTQLEQNFSEDSDWNRLKNFMAYPIYPGYSSVGEVIAVGEGCDPSLLGKKVASAVSHQKYEAFPATHISVLADNIDPDDAVFQTLAVVALASIRVAKIEPGETAVVFGAGLIGQLVARLAKIAGAVNVIIADVSENRLKYAPKEKGFYAINSEKESVEELVKKVNFGNLANVVFETTAYPPLMEKELKCAAKLGRVVVSSSPKSPSKVDFQYCSSMALTIVSAGNGIVHSPVATPQSPWTTIRDNQYFVQLLENEEISLKEMVTHKESWKNAVELYELLMKDRTQALAVHLDWRD